MKIRVFCNLVASAVGILLVSCASEPVPDRQRPYVPRVSLPSPSECSENEQRYLPDVEDALSDAGYRCVYGGGAEYRVEFSMEDGPVNADTTLTMYRQGEEIARSSARVGGPRIILRRSQVVQESFEKCLSDFRGKIPHAGGGYGSSSGYVRDDRPTDRPAYSTSGPEPAPDWQTGWKD